MTHDDRTQLASMALKGVSMGDAFGESFFGDETGILKHIAARTIPPTAWEFTDDTVMAIAVFEQLENYGRIDQDALIRLFIDNHAKDPNRGYGATARRILREISEGGNWRTIAAAAFEGMGSMGNGAAMRVAPAGAYYFDDLAAAREMAIQSAAVTHTHPDGIAGAVAVSIATALATQIKIENRELPPLEFIRQILEWTPASDTKSRIHKALGIPYEYSIETVRSILGNGINVSAPDTVPFCIWCAAHNLLDFEEALWKAISILGDRDTICAIVGGIVIMSADRDKIPLKWLTSVEDFDNSVFRNRPASSLE